jgi:hypothetical protein
MEERRFIGHLKRNRVCADLAANALLSLAGLGFTFFVFTSTSLAAPPVAFLSRGAFTTRYPTSTKTGGRMFSRMEQRPEGDRKRGVKEVDYGQTRRKS